MAKKLFKAFNKIIYFFAAILIVQSINSQTSLIIPTGNPNSGSVNDPFGTYWGYERTSLIYTFSEIGNTGYITKIGFYVNNVSSPGNAVDVTIRMKMRTTTMTANTTYNTEIAGSTIVFGPTTIPAASFVPGEWIMIDINTPFYYSGDNLQILIETNAGGSGNEPSVGAKQFRYSTNASNAFYQYWNADNTPPTGNGTRSTSRPNVRLVFSSELSFHNNAADPCLQTSFNHIKSNSLTPYFTLSSLFNFSNIQIELNTKSDFTGNSYIQSFPGTYASNTKYDFLCDNLFPALPGIPTTYFVRARVHNGSSWQNWTNELWVYTYSPTTWGWHITALEQFNICSMINTPYNNHITFNNNSTPNIAIDDYAILNLGNTTTLIATAGDQALTEGTTFYSGASHNCITVGYYNPTSAQDYHGFRFQNAAIPNGANILSAFFRPYGHTGSGCGASPNSTNELRLVIKGVAQGDCSSWSNNTNVNTGAPRYRLRGTEQVIWNVPSGVVEQWSTGSLIITVPDISNVIQEIVDQPAYVAGNAIGLIVDHNSTPGAYWRYFATMTANPSYRAELVVEFDDFENSMRTPDIFRSNWVGSNAWDKLFFDIENCGGPGTGIIFEVRDAATNNLIASGTTSPIDLNNNTTDVIYVIAKFHRNTCSPKLNNLTVTAKGVFPPVVDFNASQTTICQGECINFSDLTTNNPTAWNWTFTGATPSTSNIQNPTNICYNTPGIYSVVLSATNSACTSTQTKTNYIEVLPNPQADLISTNVTCSGSNNGTIEVTNITGGTGTIATYWTGPNGFTSNSNNLSNLQPGTYNLTLTDEHNCIFTNSVNITEPDAINFFTTINEPTCTGGGNDGSVTVSASGGVSPYNIQLGTLTQNNVTAYTFTNLNGGNYTVSITDATGCTTSGNITLTNVDIPQASFTYNGNQCFDGHSFNFTYTGIPIPGQTYSWTFTNANIPTSTLQNPVNITWNNPGTYAISLDVNAGGCITSTTQNITIYPSPAPNLVITDASCGNCNGSISVNPVFSNYSWSNLQNTQSISGLCPNTYSVTVTDLNNCTASISGIINNLGTIPNVNITTTDPTCAGLCNGTATVNATGPSSFWYNFSAGSTPNNQTNVDLCPGNYFVTVADASNLLCSTVSNFTINTNPGMNLTINTVDASCGFNNGQASVFINGTYSIPLTYNWSNGEITQSITVPAGNYTITVTDSNNCTVSGSATINDLGIPFTITTTINENIRCYNECNGSATVTAIGTGPFTYLWSNGETNATSIGLCAGNHSVTVTENGCSLTDNINISQPDQLSATISSSYNPHCGLSDGSASVLVSGGIPPYSYQWNSFPPQYGFTANNLHAGTYTVTVRDNNNCTTSTNVSLVDIGIISVDLNINNVSCPDDQNGSAIAIVNGGTPNYQFSWSNGFSQNTANNFSIVSDLGPGNISVSVTDNFGCTATNSGIIVPPTPINFVSIDINPATCNGLCDGNVSVNVSGGTAPYTFIWQDNQSGSQNKKYNLCSGNYNVTVHDALCCSNQTSFSISEPAPIQIVYEIINPSCLGAKNGSISFSINGGTGPYILSYNGNTFSETTLTQLNNGTYNITIIDANGCQSVTNDIVLREQLNECLIIPNAFTPNEDGINDTWIIENIELFPAAYIYIFNRWGQQIWQGRPGDEWDGKFNNKQLPMGTYLYIVNLFNGSEPYKGTVTIIY